MTYKENSGHRLATFDADTVGFAGNFDGNGHIISNLAIGTKLAPATNKFCGLFGNVYQGTIYNLGIENVLIYSTGDYTGGIAGQLNENVNVDSCYVTGYINGGVYTGGLVGMSINSAVTKCYTAGSVASFGLKPTAGGLLGSAKTIAGTGTISNCYSTASVITGADGWSGGLIGELYGWDTDAGVTVSKCYSTGNVASGAGTDSAVGGLIGGLTKGTVQNCYFNKRATLSIGGEPQNTVGVGIGEDIGSDSSKSPSELMNADFIALLGSSIWDEDTGNTNQGFAKLKDVRAVSSNLFKITYRSNGDNSGELPTDTGAYPANMNVIVAANTGSLAKTGYAFTGWSTVASKTSIYNIVCSAYEITDNTTLYARWNAIPIDISLTSSTIAVASTGADVKVGTLNATDSDTADTFTYELVSGDGDTHNSSFNISGSDLRTGNALIAGDYSTRIKVTDNEGAAYEEAFTITVTATAPTAATVAVSDKTKTTATLNGTVNANNYSTTVSFEYGETTDYGTTVDASPKTVTGTANTSVSAAISGLTAGTTYHYRVKAVNAGGTTYGEDMSFTTIAETTSTPVIGTASGSLLPGTAVTISCDTAGATIYYTTDGSEPTASSTAYTGPITINDPLTLRAVAVKTKYINSSEVGEAYTIPATVTVNTATELKNCIESPHVSTINLVNGTEYTYDGTLLTRSLIINGNGAVINAGAGISDTIIKLTGVLTSDGFVFLVVKGTLGNVSTLNINNVTLRSSGSLLLSVLNAKEYSSLSLDNVIFEGFYANVDGGTGIVNNFAVHAEPLSVSTTVTNCVFGKSNAFRNAIATRGGTVTITANTFTGTDYPGRLRFHDNYEYAIYLYGGNCTVTNNTITGFDSIYNESYASAGIALCPYYEIHATLKGNEVTGNSYGINPTGSWHSLSYPAITYINISEDETPEYIGLTTNDNAFIVGEALPRLNYVSQNISGDISITIDQNDNFKDDDIVDSIYWSSGYISPFITSVTSVTSSSAELSFNTNAETKLLMKNAKALVVQASSDDGATWEIVKTMDAFTSAASTMVNLDAGKSYRLRIAITIASKVDDRFGTTTNADLTAYSNSISVVLKPAVTTVSPATGLPSGGASVTITGLNLAGATDVKFGDTSAASFNVDSSTQITAISPSGSGAVYVTVTTPGGTSETGSGSVYTYNGAPTDIALSASSINENISANTTVGTLSSTDPDAANTFTYTLVTGTGDTDNASFNINGSSLRITGSPDYETKNSYTVRVRTTDQGGLYYEEAFIITISDLNETPEIKVNTELTLDEDATAVTIDKLKLNTLDPESKTVTYTVTSTPSKGTLKKDGTTLGLNETFTQANVDEGKITYTPALNKNGADSFGFNVSDGVFIITEQSFSITIAAVNDKPILTAPAADSYTDTSAADTFSNSTGTFTATDAEGTVLTYGITGGTSGSTTIGGVTYNVSKAGSYGTLYVKSSGEYCYVPAAAAINAVSANTSDTFTVSATDGSLTDEATYTVNITAANDKPILTAPAADSYTDTSAADTFSNSTGTFTATDAEGTILTYGITGGTSGNTTINTVTYNVSKAGSYGTLYVKSSGEYCYVPTATSINAVSANTSDTFIVSVTDGSLTDEATYTVNITAANDKPILTAPAADSYTDTSAADTFSNSIGTFTATDAEGTVLTYGITGGTSGSTTIGGVTYNVSKAGSYGTLYVKSSGEYCYVPTAASINAVSANTSDTFTVSATDGSLTDEATYTVNITAANDKPILTAPVADSYTDTSAADTFSNSTGTFTATDAEGTVLTYGITGGTSGSTTIGGVTYNVSKAGSYGTLYVKSSGEYCYVPTAAAINAVSADKSDTFTVSATDGSLTDEDTYTVNITAANDTPILTAPSADSYTDTAAADTFTNSTGTFTATDAEGTVLTYGITGGTSGNTTIGGVTYNVSKAGTYGTLYVNGSSGQYCYVPTASAINAVSADKIDTFTVSATDGSLTDEDTYTVNITAANDTPILTAPTADSYTDTLAADTFSNSTGTFTASDAEGTVLTYGITGGTNGNTTIGGVTYNVSKAGSYGTLYVKSSGEYCYVPTAADINAVNANTSDTFTVSATDGSLTDEDTYTVNITAANDKPILTAPVADSYTDTSAADTFSNSTGTFTATDAEGTILTYGITGGTSGSTTIGGVIYNVSKAGSYGTLYVKSSGEYCYVPTAAAINAISANTSDTFTVSATDGSLTDEATYTVNITAANDKPILTAPAADSYIDTLAADTFSNSTGSFTASDAEGTVLTYGITGGRSGSTTIGGVTYNVSKAGSYGTLYVKSSGEYCYVPTAASINAVSANTSDTFTVSVTDGNLTDEATYTVNITAANDKPILTAPAADSYTDTSAADTFSNSTGSYSASDAEGTVLSYGITSGTSGSTTIGGVTYNVSKAGSYGTLYVKSSGEYCYVPTAATINAISADKSDSFTVNATDGSLTDEATYTVNITAANDKPILTAPAADSYTDTSAADTFSNSTGTFTATDAEGTILTYGITGGTSGSTTIGGVIYNVSKAGSYGTLYVKSSGEYCYVPTAAAINAISANTSDTFTVSATDGSLTDEATYTVNITAVNDKPIAINNTYTINEDTAIINADLSSYVYDIENDTLTYILVSDSTSHGKFTFNTDGSCTYIPDENWFGTETFTWHVEETNTVDKYKSNTVTTTIKVDPVNDTPVIKADLKQYFPNGSSNPIVIPTYTDVEKEVVTWSISGTDSALFNINSLTGELSFKQIPYYGTPLDSNKDNIYELTLRATDSSKTGEIAITVEIYVPIPEKKDEGVEVLVNGKSETAGELTVKESDDGKTTATVVLNSEKLQEKIDTEEKGVVVTVPVKAEADNVKGVLTGAMVKSMETKEAVLEVKTEMATYTLPAQQISINDVSKQFGEDVKLGDIEVSVEIAKPTDETVQIVKTASRNGGYALVTQAVEFNINCTYNGQMVEVSKFEAYVERLIPIPAGVDPKKVTTGVVVRKDGTSYSVPTQITLIDGVYYAKINSLTNSTYTVVWNPVEFTDITDHWAKEAVNDMGARMVVNGTGDGTYAPDRDMTRAEFATIIVRALGLDSKTTSSSFSDVKETDWFAGYVHTAVEYGIIKGFDDGSFKHEAKITREQAMTMTARAMNVTKLNVDLNSESLKSLLDSFSDGNTVSSYAGESAAKCISAGIILGRANNNIAPKDFITRAEVAVIVQRLLVKSNLI